ncbi:MAG TPA: T9SS type A sorting domain-containing protein [Bacteroidia bacterium]|jgi:sugar lactone lactonase YvrE|nr:T9SS type A sorting domain-containing protein [Bacteroidia bacterium]
MKKSLAVILLTFSYLVVPVCKAQIISTVAGNGTANFSGDGGPATNAELNGPYDVAIDASNNLYIADFLNNRVRKLTPTGTITTIAGNGVMGYSGDGGQASIAEIQWPNGLTVDKFGNLYISDIAYIRKVSPGGIISHFAGIGGGYSGDGGQATAAGINQPYGMVSDASGNIYIADYGNNVIRKVNTSGIISTIAGNGFAGYSGDGGQATTAEMNGPFNVKLDVSGNIYISDLNNNRIRKVDVSGIITTIAGNGSAGFSGDGGQATAAELFNPTGLAIDGSGNIYIADAANDRVRKINPSGIISTAAGNGKPGFSGDGGPATNAEFDGANGAVIDNVGNLYIPDTFNNRIRKITNPWLAGISDISENNKELIIFPNPSNGLFQLGIRNGQLGINGTAEVYNMLEEIIYSKQFFTQGSIRTTLNSQLSIDISNNANGIYLYRVTSNSGELIGEGKLIIQK